MSLADNSVIANFVDSNESYHRQMTSFRRTRAAILESSKLLLAKQGYARTSMIDIADTAEISRATLYNHFRDKVSVYDALLESEIARIFSAARMELTQRGALAYLAGEISADQALAMLRSSDPALFARLYGITRQLFWAEIQAHMQGLFGPVGNLALTWLVGQVVQPLESQQIHAQIELLLPT